MPENRAAYWKSYYARTKKRQRARWRGYYLANRLAILAQQRSSRITPGGELHTMRQAEARIDAALAGQSHDAL